MKSFAEMYNESNKSKEWFFKKKSKGVKYEVSSVDIKNALLLAKEKKLVYKNSQELYSAINNELNLPFDIVNIGNYIVREMVKRGFLTKHGRKVEIIVEPDDIEIKEEPEEVEDIESSTIRVSDLSKGKTKKLRIPKAKKGGKLEDFMQTILFHMNGSAKGKLLLTGDPGVGKTNQVKNVMTAIGMQTITIEVPHISEDELITIPYLVKRGDTEERYEFQMTANFEVINAESALISKLKRTKKVKDNETKKFLNKNKIFKEYIKRFNKLISRIQEKYKTVLLVDEFYRNSDKRTMNIMRTILDGNIGTTPIPKDVYIIFASNMDNSDGSLADIPENHQFQEVEFDTPAKEDWLRYMADRYTNFDLETGEEDLENKLENPISKEVYEAFVDNMEDLDLGVKDMDTEAEIRISPRRWDEIMKVISTNLPCQTLNDAQNLISFLKTNMTDIYTGETHFRYQHWRDVLDKLILETSNIDSTSLNENKPSDWQDNLDFQMKTKLKLGSDRKYVPLVGGLPGIGKTTLINQLGKKYNLKVIRRDVSTITDKDEVIGLPIQTGSGLNSTTTFSEPPLYKEIMNQYDSSLKPQGDSKYTHLLFLDEFTRTSVDVFNAIRSILLDGKVGSYALPEDILIIGAMNPTGQGTLILPDHTKDVVDFIDAEADYNKLISYFKNNSLEEKYTNFYGFNLNEIIVNIHEDIVSTHQSDYDINGDEITDLNTKKWWWKISGVSPAFYISPRIMDDMINGSLENIYSYLEGIEDFDKNKNYSPEEITNFVNIIKDTIYKQYDLTTAMPMKHQSDSEDEDRGEFLLSIENIINKYEEAIGNGFSSIQSDNVNYLIDLVDEDGEMIENIIEDIDNETKYVLTQAVDEQDTDIFSNDVSSIIRNYMNKQDTAEQKLQAVVNLYKLFGAIEFSKLSDGQKIQIINDFNWYDAIKKIVLDFFDNNTNVSHLVGLSLDEEPTTDLMKNIQEIVRKTRNESNPRGTHNDLFTV